MNKFLALLKKDLLLEMRSKTVLSSMIIYAALVLTIYGAALSQAYGTVDIEMISSGLLWVLIVFTSLIGLNKTFFHETEAGALEALLVAPFEKALIFLSKLSANLIFLFILELIMVPLFFFFFMQQKDMSADFILIIVPLLLGNIGIAGVGTLLASITFRAKSGDILLAILLVPLIFPLLLSCVSATGAIIIGTSMHMDTLYTSLGVALAYDIIMLAASYALYEFVIAP